MDLLPTLLSMLFLAIGFFLGGYVKNLKSKALHGDSNEKIAGLAARLAQSETLLKKQKKPNKSYNLKKKYWVMIRLECRLTLGI